MAKISFLRKYLFLIFIFLLAFTIRVYKVSKIPYEFDGDEAAFGYYGFSVSRNLSDEYGNKLPLYFPSIGDYKYPGYAYLSVPLISIFGLNVFSARLLSVLSGSLLCIVIYFLALYFFESKRVAVFASVLASISPYGIIFSRGAYESNLAAFLVSLGILIFLLFVKMKKIKFLVLSFLVFLFAIYSYSASRLFLALFLPVTFWSLRNSLNSKNRRVFLIYCLVTLSVIFIAFLDPRSRVRANDIGFTKDPFPKDYLVESIHDDGVAWQGSNLLLTRFFHNKYSAFGLSFVRRYFQHFSPTYLFIESNPGMPKYSAPNVGLLYFFEFATLLLGIYGLSKFKTKLKPILIAWIIVGPISSALTIETPNPIRMLITFPALIMLSALGVWFLYEKIVRKKLFIFLIVCLLIPHFMYFWHQYSLHRLYANPWYTDGGVKEMVESVNELSPRFSKVIVPGDPYIFFLFYNKITPHEFLKSSVIQPEKLGKWERVESTGKIVFKMPTNCPKVGRKNTLYICKGSEIPQNSVLHKVVRFKDGAPAFLLLEFIPYSESQKIELPQGLSYMAETDLSFKDALLSEDSGRYW